MEGGGWKESIDIEKKENRRNDLVVEIDFGIGVKCSSWKSRSGDNWHASSWDGMVSIGEVGGRGRANEMSVTIMAEMDTSV